MMDLLYQAFAPIVETPIFATAFSVLIFINPVALAPQLWSAIKAKSVDGISIPMLLIFLVVQTIMTLYGIQTKSTGMFLAMFLSMLITLGIILAVLIRRHANRAA